MKLYTYVGKGKDREAASAAAKAGLILQLRENGISTPADADIHLEVIALPKKKILGLFGGSDAEVKASYEDRRKKAPSKKPLKEKRPQEKARNYEKKEAPVKKEAKERKDASAVKEAPAKKENYEKKEASAQNELPKKANHFARTENDVILTAADVDVDGIVNFISTVVKGFKVDDAVVTGSVVDGIMQINIESDNYGIIIGKHGETLESLQYLASLVGKKLSGNYMRVVINCGNYREKRAETLKNLARRNAEFVLRTGRKSYLEPMNPYERRLIHTAIQEIEGVESFSIGTGASRKVVIQPEGGAVRAPQRRGGAPRRSGASKPAQKPVVKDFTKFGKIEINKD